MVKQKDFPKSHKVVLLHLLIVNFYQNDYRLTHFALHLK